MKYKALLIALLAVVLMTSSTCSGGSDDAIDDISKVTDEQQNGNGGGTQSSPKKNFATFVGNDFSYLAGTWNRYAQGVLLDTWVFDDKGNGKWIDYLGSSTTITNFKLSYDEATKLVIFEDANGEGFVWKTRVYATDNMVIFFGDKQNPNGNNATMAVKDGITWPEYTNDIDEALMKRKWVTYSIDGELHYETYRAREFGSNYFSIGKEKHTGGWWGANSSEERYVWITEVDYGTSIPYWKTVDYAYFIVYVDDNIMLRQYYEDARQTMMDLEVYVGVDPD